MYEVDVEAGGSREEYWAVLEFTDRKGRPHRKEIRKKRKADKNSNILQAAVEAFQVLRVPCEVNLYIDSEYVLTPLRQRWIAAWETNGWRNARGKPIKNVDQWQQLSVAMAWHYVTPRETRIREGR